MNKMPAYRKIVSMNSVLGKIKYQEKVNGNVSSNSYAKSQLFMKSWARNTFWGIFFTIFFASSAYANIGAGVIKTFKGQVSITRNTAHIQASVGLMLMAVDKVVTGPESSVGITLQDGTLISFGANSVTQLNEFKYDPVSHDGNMLVSASKGTMRFVTGLIGKHNPSAVSIRTPGATIGIRGTDFIVSLTKFQDSSDASETKKSGNEAGNKTEPGIDPVMIEVPEKDYEIGKYVVTQGEWRAIMGNNPSHFSSCGNNCPVETVSWNDVQKFIQRLNAKSGKQYRLPTEAEWEYACYGGNQQEFCENDNPDVLPWYEIELRDKSASTTHPVGQMSPNGYGLYDMNSGVWQWMGDCLHGFCSAHKLRGGSWNDVSQYLRSPAPFRLNDAINRDEFVGFRLARKLILKETFILLPDPEGKPTGIEIVSNNRKVVVTEPLHGVELTGGNIVEKTITQQEITKQFPVVMQTLDDIKSYPLLIRIPGKDYEIGKYDVTQGEWRAVMGSNPSHFSSCGDNCPVEMVSWDDAQEFIKKLNAKTGRQYRLPTEAEWEYACYGGSKTEFCGGGNIDSVAWYSGNSSDTTHPVGQRQANGYGIYDMSGNVWQWVNDCRFGECSKRVLRGGSWANRTDVLRAGFRSYGAPGDRNSAIGFRLARTL